MIDGFGDYPDEFKMAIPFLVASVIYHREYLQNALPSNHLLFTSRLWTQNYHVRLAPYVVCGVFRCPHTGLTATGVTLNTAIMTSVKEVTTEVAQLRQEVESITEKLTNTIPRECVNLILDNVNISGTQPVTRQSLVELEGRLVEAIQTQLNSLATTRTRKI
jgi:hypothetical protein